MRIEWRKKAIKELVNQNILDKPLDGNHGEIHPKKADFTKFGVPFIMASDLENGEVNQKTCKFISKVQANSLRKGFAKDGDVLLSHKGTIGRSALLRTTHESIVLTPQVTYYRVLEKSVLDNRFLYYAFHDPVFQDEIKNIAKAGSTRAYIGITKQLQLRVPVPPLSEQKRIVAILDEVFTGIDAAIANTEKNITNARELFESHLNQVFSRKDKTWKNRQLQEILTIQPRNGWSPPAKHHSDQGTPVVTLSSVTGFHFDGKQRKLTSAPTKEDAHYWLQEGEFLITRSNTPLLVGHVAICEGLEEPTICCDLIMKMTIDPEQANTKFIYWHFRTKKLREIIMESAHGANPTMKKINKGIVQALPVILPELSTQKKIVQRLDNLEVETQKLELIYQQKLTALNELKQSILQKAFTGQLTAEQAKKTAKEEIAA